MSSIREMTLDRVFAEVVSASFTTGILMEVLSCVKGLIPNHSTGMFKVEILAVGSQKNASYRTLNHEYLKRLAPFVKISVRHLEAVAFTSVSQREQIRAKEGEKIRLALSKTSKRILLTESGKLFDSLQFAKQLPIWSEHESQPMTFIIAGPLGHDRSLEELVDEKLSLSPLTFPHEMTLAILLEQLYRGVTILTGKTYHY